ncbi:MAG: hypothetical protein CBE47_01095 [Pelagibacteraceae bacterium TMED287]|nr:MAG: hypothetical protein CBE47_01095 [Pelagibacteraceae bacterium TMED287]|tara:strand:- start:1216 stop:1551 length:336 start_codon:yes stop_codon:yes gene_type:complete
MFNKKLFVSLAIFSIFMVFTSIIKTQTRLIEKNINSNKRSISLLENEIYESQLDFYYLTSPDYLEKKIIEYSNDEYLSIKFSEIYFTLNQFLEEKKSTVKFIKNEKKVQKK